MAPMAPASAPSKVCDLQEKSTTAEGADVFGCADELEWLSTRAKYCPNGAMAGVNPQRHGGASIAPSAPLRTPFENHKSLQSRVNQAVGAKIRPSLGAEMGLSAFHFSNRAKYCHKGL
jgi:hypothetical protein